MWKGLTAGSISLAAMIYVLCFTSGAVYWAFLIYVLSNDLFSYYKYTPSAE